MFKLLQKRNSSQRGFTLIELLVVIAIIGMLSSVVLASMNTARTKARDARRMADIKQVQTALELYNSDNQKYPAVPTNSQVSNMTSDLVTPGYIGALPTDPKYTGADGYRYYPGTNQSGYTLLVKLEKNGGNLCKIIEYPGYSSWSSYGDCY